MCGMDVNGISGFSHYYNITLCHSNSSSAYICNNFFLSEPEENGNFTFQMNDVANEDELPLNRIFQHEAYIEFVCAYYSVSIW